MNKFGSHIKIDRLHRSYVKFNGVTIKNRLWAAIDCGYCSVVWNDSLQGATTEGDGFNIYLDDQLDTELRFNAAGDMVNINDLANNIIGARFFDYSRTFLGQQIPANTWSATYKSPNNPVADTEYEIKVKSVINGIEITTITGTITSEDYEGCSDQTKLNCGLEWYKRSKSDGAGSLPSNMRPGCNFTHESYLNDGGTVLMLGRGENDKISTAGVISHFVQAVYSNAAGTEDSPNSPVTIQNSGNISPPESCILYTRDVVAEIPVTTTVDEVVYTLKEVSFGFGSYSLSSCFGGKKAETCIFLRSI